MEKILIKKVKIGDSLSISCTVRGKEVRLSIMGGDVSISTDFKIYEWDKFVQLVDQAWVKFKENK